MSEHLKIENKEVKTGVFVYRCGSNIYGLVDCKKLAGFARTLPDVVYSEDNLYTCSKKDLTSVKKVIKDYDLNRVIVCSCVPRTHEFLFRKIIEELRFNEYLFNFINVRDQCTWVHARDSVATFEKIKDLMKRGILKAAKLEPLEDMIHFQKEIDGVC